MKKLLVIAMIAVLMFSFSACGSDSSDVTGTADTSVQTEEPEQTGVANPFVDCASMEEAAQIAGFEMTVPESAGSMPLSLIRAVEGNMIQAFYYSEEGGPEILIRKSTDRGDISGDYNEYEKTWELTAGSMTEHVLTVKGDGEKIYVATWFDETYGYAITSTEGLTDEEVCEMVEWIL